MYHARVLGILDFALASLFPHFVAPVERPAADRPAARVPVVQRPRLPGAEQAVVGVAARVIVVVVLWRGRPVVFVLYGLRLMVVVWEAVVFEATSSTLFVESSSSTVVISDFVGMAMVIVVILVEVTGVVKITLLKVILSKIVEPVTETAVVDHFVVFRLKIVVMIDVIKALVLDRKMIVVFPRPLALLPPLPPLRRSLRLVEWQVVRHLLWLIPVVPGMIRLKVSVRAVVQTVVPQPVAVVALLLVDDDDVLVAHVDADEGQLFDYDAVPNVELAVEEVIRGRAEVKPLDDVNVLLSVDETSAVARPPGSLEAVVFFPQSEMVPLGRRQQRGDVVRASIVLAKSSPPPSSMTSWARATSLASWRR